MKKYVSFILVLIIVFSSTAACFAGEFDKELGTDTYMVLDLTTETVIAESCAHERRYPASLTKMMTAILAYEYFSAQPYGLETLVYADEESANVVPTIFGLREGEEMTVDEALNIMLLMSANDIAVMLAKSVGGTTEYFARLMNDKAKELGCTDTNFVTPNGLHDDNHYSTAADLAKIAMYLLKNDYLAAIVGQSEYDYAPTNLHQGGTVYSTNLLYNSESKIYVERKLRRIKYDKANIFGVKTGTTPEAGGCLITAAEKDGTKVLVIILNSRTSEWDYQFERFADTHLLLDWVFVNYRTAKPLSAGYTPEEKVPVKRGEFNKVEVEMTQDVFVTLPCDVADSSIRTEVKTEEYVTAPITKGTKLGTITVFNGNKTIGTYDLVAQKDVNKGGILSVFGIEDAEAKIIFARITRIIVIIFIAVILIFAVLLIVGAINRARRKKRIEELKKKKAELEAKRREEWGREYDYKKYHAGKETDKE